MKHLIVIFIGILISIISFMFFPAPFIWIFLSWFPVLLYISLTKAESSARLILFYISFIPLTIGIFEMYLWIKQEPKTVEDYNSGMLRKHPILGAAPKKNTTPAHARYFRGERLFNVVYSIDADGLRVSPPHDAEHSEGAILFFGGSFTYGSGVNDEETMPYRVGIRTRGKYKIYNFAFRGYGPHQMLSALEQGLVEEIVKFKPKHAIYQALPGHARRSAGLVSWGKYDPKYILKDGEVVYDGNFSKGDKGGNILTALSKGLKKSLIIKKILDKKSFSKEHFDLFLGIVEKSKKKIETLYPGCKFHVIFRGGEESKIFKALEERGISVYATREIFKGIADRSRLIISEHDRHPSPLDHDMAAEFIVNKIMKRAASAPYEGFGSSLFEYVDQKVCFFGKLSRDINIKRARARSPRGAGIKDSPGTGKRVGLSRQKNRQ